MPTNSFSRRNNCGVAAEIKVREGAPEEVRIALIDTSYDCGWGPVALRTITCKVLRKNPDPNSWSEYPNVDREVRDFVDNCPWFKVYDIIEALYAAVAKQDVLTGKIAPKFAPNASKFAEEVNNLFIEEGTGWQLENGQVISRGDGEFEKNLKEAAAALGASGRPTALSHLHEARLSISRRPKPNVAGAIYHAMGSLEAVARDVSGLNKATLGDILKKHPDLAPKPLDNALSQMWGYASNIARHVEEGKEASREEAELLVGVAAAMVTYLCARAK